MTNRKDNDTPQLPPTTRRQFLGQTLALGAAGAMGGLEAACSHLGLGVKPRRPNRST